LHSTGCCALAAAPACAGCRRTPVCSAYTTHDPLKLWGSLDLDWLIEGAMSEIDQIWEPARHALSVPRAHTLGNAHRSQPQGLLVNAAPAVLSPLWPTRYGLILRSIAASYCVSVAFRRLVHGPYHTNHAARRFMIAFLSNYPTSTEQRSCPLHQFNSRL
jgi:hypothetical protein